MNLNRTETFIAENLGATAFKILACIVCVRGCGCGCVCLRPSTVKALSVWNSWGCQGTDQRCCVEDVEFLCRFPSSTLWNAEPNLSTSRFILFVHQKRAQPRLSQYASCFQNIGPPPLTRVAFSTHYIVSRSTFASALTRGFAIYLGKVKVTTNFSIESSPRQSTQPSPSSFISVSENIIFHLQRRKLQPTATGEKTK